jgi:hypothetical protein
MAYMVKNPGLLPNMESVKAGDIGKRREEMAEMIEGTWRSCIEAGNGMGDRLHALNVDAPEDLFIADAIIANPPSMGHIHCAEKLGIPLHMVFTMPWSPTRAFHHPLAAMEYGEVETSMANYFSFGIMEVSRRNCSVQRNLLISVSAAYLARPRRSHQQVPNADPEARRNQPPLGPPVDTTAPCAV